jgi:hypothetical protein
MTFQKITTGALPSTHSYFHAIRVKNSEKEALPYFPSLSSCEAAEKSVRESATTLAD